MWLTMTCGCGKKLRAREEHAGKKVTCPDCGDVLRIPRPEIEEVRPAVVRKPRRRRVEEYEDEEPPPLSRKAILAMVFACLTFVLPVVATIPAVILAIAATVEAHNSRGRVRGKSMATNAIVVTLLGTVCGLLLGIVVYSVAVASVKQARERAAYNPRVGELELITLGMQGYLETKGHYPPPVVRDAQGKPLYSWRVEILPFIGEGALYEQFKKDEPWDSPANLPLLDRMPQVFRGPGDAFGGGTRLKAIVTPGKQQPTSIFSDTEQVTRQQVTDGLANTLMVVELGDPVPWTKPDDIPFRTDDPQPIPPEVRGLGSGNSSFKFLAITAEGRVHSLPSDMDPQTLRALITCNGGEGPIAWDRLER